MKRPITGIAPVIGRFIPGMLSNPIYPKRIEPNFRWVKAGEEFRGDPYAFVGFFHVQHEESVRPDAIDEWDHIGGFCPNANVDSC